LNGVDVLANDFLRQGGFFSRQGAMTQRAQPLLQIDPALSARYASVNFVNLPGQI
jgi:hypothetical protein